MAEDGAALHQAVMVVDVEKILPLWKQRGDELHLIAVLGDVGLETVASGMVRSLARPVGRQIVFLRPFA
jgi:hypothetical protein